MAFFAFLLTNFIALRTKISPKNLYLGDEIAHLATLPESALAPTKMEPAPAEEEEEEA